MENYSKKVMENFMSPKNMGEIKNADGVGKVGNPTCLLENTLLQTNSKLTKIRDIKKTDLIVSHNGKYNKISGIFDRSVNESIIVLKNRLGEIKLTKEHLVYAIKVPKRDKYLRTENKKTLIPAWYHAEQLDKGDLILYSILSEIKDCEHIIIENTKKKFDYNSKSIPSKIKLDSDFLRLAGYYLSEGYYSDKVTKTHIAFCFNLKEDNLVEDIIRISEKIFGITPTVRKNESKHSQVVYINSVFVVRLFKILFESGAKNKDIPEIFMTLPPEKQKPLIYGIWKGDGFFNTRIPRGGYSTISKELVHKLKILLLRQGIIPSVYYETDKIDKNGLKHQECYRIHVGDKESTTKLSKIIGVTFYNLRPEAIKSWIDKNVLYTPVTSKKTENYSGKVYNLEINTSHSYNTEAFTVHNCGDIMWIYIKVSKDKAGKEIIKDIKFKTLGCAAAIATSSMVTELAKGKTLDKAFNITRADVAENLGGLPPVKMHCSNLAADGLQAAINDYYSKHGKKTKKIKTNACTHCCTNKVCNHKKGR
jgi:nitrogen fixation protein NifU and related proteins